MKKQYKKPTLEVVVLDVAETVITTSGDPMQEENFGGGDGEEF